MSQAVTGFYTYPDAVGEFGDHRNLALHDSAEVTENPNADAVKTLIRRH
jgi:hypothetical protein